MEKHGAYPAYNPAEKLPLDGGVKRAHDQGERDDALRTGCDEIKCLMNKGYRLPLDQYKYQQKVEQQDTRVDVHDEDLENR